MATTIATQLSDRMHTIDEQLLTALRNASDEQLADSAGPTSPSIGFHAWHVARYADRNQAMLAKLAGAGDSAELWDSEQIASKWGFDTSKLGDVQTGMGMSDSDAAELTLPAKSELVGYAERTLRLLDDRFASLDDRALSEEMPDSGGNRTTVGAALLSHLTHASRHLGMIEALKGVHGERGTASA